MNKVRLYWQVLLFSGARFLHYKNDVVGLIAARLLTLVGLIALWQATASGGEISFASSDILIYFLIAIGLSEIVGFENMRIASDIGNQVISGQLSSTLLRPVNLIMYKIAEFNGERLVSKMLAATMIFIGILLRISALGLFEIVGFLLLVVAGFVITHQLGLILATLSFYIDQISDIRLAVYLIGSVLAGVFIPIDLLPRGVETALYATPIPFILYAPVSVVTERTALWSLPVLILAAFIWVVLLRYALRATWHRGIREYEAVGL